MKKVYVFLAEGFEEMEAVTPIDLLRRAGVDAKLVSVTGNRAVTGAHGVTCFLKKLRRMPICWYCPADCPAQLTYRHTKG